MHRRHLIKQLSAATLLAAPLGALLGACQRATPSDEPVAVHWGRDACTQCQMILSDPRFAAQIRGGPHGVHAKFDDVGCAAVWLDAQGWSEVAVTAIWVADLHTLSTQDVKWLDARRVWYISGSVSPMGYSFGAVREQREGSVDYAAMRLRVRELARHRL